MAIALVQYCARSAQAARRRSPVSDATLRGLPPAIAAQPDLHRQSPLSHDNRRAARFAPARTVDRLKKPEAIAGAIRKKTGRLDGFAHAAGVPMIVLCATAKDAYRKPATGAWSFFTERCNGGVAAELASSFFVGDAAGRPGDFSDSDREFARSARLPFHDEKAFFLEIHPPSSAS